MKPSRKSRTGRKSRARSKRPPAISPSCLPADDIFATLQATIDGLAADAERELLQFDLDLIVAVIAALPHRIEAARQREVAATAGHERALRELQRAMRDAWKP